LIFVTSSQHTIEMPNYRGDPDVAAVAFVGGFNDFGGGRYSVANFEHKAAVLNPHIAARFFSWRHRRTLSNWINERHGASLVVGQSLGGFVAARTAIANPGKIGVLITVDPVSPVSLVSPLNFTWQTLCNSVGTWIAVAQRRRWILARAANWWGPGPEEIADRFVATNFAHGDFFSTMDYLRKLGGVLPNHVNWDIPR
jgi:pimeloyl-ACP methyl ester carboxylesterase